MEEIPRRRALIQGGSALLFLSGSSGLAAAKQEEQRQKAKREVAKRENVPEDSIETIAESVRSWSILDESYYEPKFFIPQNNKVRRILLSQNGRPVPRNRIRKRVAEKYSEKYGKLSPRLHEAVQQDDSDESHEVIIWTDGIDRERAKRNVDYVGRRFPESGSKTYDEAPRFELTEELQSRISSRTDGVAEAASEVNGVTVVGTASGARCVEAECTSDGLQRLEAIDGIWRIFQSNDEAEDDIDDSNATNRVLSENDTTYNAAEERIGVMEDDNPETYQEVNLRDTYVTNTDSNGDPVVNSQHANQVIECAASKADALPGTAFQAGLYYADNFYAETSSVQDMDNKMSWFNDNRVSAINASRTGYQNDRSIYERDIRFNQYSFNLGLNLVFSAGNNEPNVGTPGKGLNQISVGALNTQNDGDWQNDEARPASNTQNPTSAHDTSGNFGTPDYPIEKPEVSAPGNDIVVPNTVDYVEASYQFHVDSQPGVGVNGTSFSSPQAAGMLTLMEKFSRENNGPKIRNSPELAKAALMATARREGIDGNDREIGTGCIYGPEVKRLFDFKKWDYYAYPESSQSESTGLNLSGGEAFKAVLVWGSNIAAADYNIPTDDLQSDINLEFGLKDPDGNIIEYGQRFDAGFQKIRLASIPEDGFYTLEVFKDRWDAQSSSRDVAVAWSTGSHTSP